MSKRLLFLLRLLISVGILFALFKLVPYQKLWEIYQGAEVQYIFFGLFIFLSCHLLAIERWKYLLSTLQINVPFKETLYAFLSGLFFNLFFPSFVAGDVFRGVTIAWRYGEKKSVASSVLMDRFSGAVALNIVILVSFIAGRKLFPQKEILWAVLILSCLIGLGAAVIFSKRFFSFLMRIFKKGSTLRMKLDNFHNQLYFFKQHPLVFLKSVAISLPLQLLVPFGFFVIAKAFGVRIGLLPFFILVPIIMFIALIPITIAGIGTREAAAVYFLSLIGIEKSIGLSISLLNLVFFILSGIIGGICYVSVYHRWLQSHP